MQGGDGTLEGITITDAARAPLGYGDFDGDGVQDVLVRHAGNGVVGQYQVTEDGVQPYAQIGGLGLGWSFAGIGDLGGDGTDDILWLHEATRQLAQFEMDGGARTTKGVGFLDSAREVAGIGDFKRPTASMICCCATQTMGS